MLITVLVSAVLSACSGGASQAQAHANKAKLDQELTHARTDLGLPERLLAPVTTKEVQVAKGDGGFFYDYGAAASKYHSLLDQLTGIEQSAPQTLHQQAQDDLQAFADILNERRGEKFSEIDVYQARYDEATLSLNNAKTNADYAHVSDLAAPQTLALQSLWPAYQELQILQSVIKAISDSGLSTDAIQAVYDSDMRIIREGDAPQRYTALTLIVDAQIAQVQATAATGKLFITQNLLAQFQGRIDQLRQYVAGFQGTSQLNVQLQAQYGNMPSADTFQKQHDDDAAQLAASTSPDHTALTASILKHSSGMNSALLRAKTLYDYVQMDAFIRSDAVWKRTIINEQPNPAYHSGQAYPLAYEYIGEDGLLDNDIGIGPASKPEDYARTDKGFQAADFRITSLVENLHAMLDNYDAATDQVNAMDDSARINPVHEKPHPSDLQLMQYYGVTAGKVVMVSLREQIARFYDHGNMVGYTYVTTGDLDVPSVPGFWTALNRHSPSDPNSCSTHPNTCPRDAATGNPIAIPAGFGDVFTPPKPGEYVPTPIHYDVAYHEGGFWLHDAYWRHELGPETDLPHYDPSAFSGGSHGCVNMPYAVPYVNGRQIGWDMEQVYNWTPLGTPIVLY